MPDSASSSDFSSDEEDNDLSMDVSYDPSLAPHVVAIDDLEDPVEAEMSDDLIVSLRAETHLDPLLPTLEPVLTTPNNSYDAYTTAIYVLSSQWPPHASMTLQRALVRAIYRRFHDAFPLTPAMYSEYIHAVDDVAHKVRLHTQATQDYWSVSLTLDHLQLLAEHQDEIAGITWSTIENAVETALTTVGNDFMAGHDVWRVARELAIQHFDAQDGDHDAAKETAVRALFTRQMRLPLQQNDLTMSEFRAWNTYNTLASTTERDTALHEAEHYQQQVFGGAVYKKFQHFEARVTAALAGTPLADATPPESPEKVWTQYLRYTRFKLVPLMATPDDADRFVVCLFERAVASVCLSSSLWRQYVDYVATHHKDQLVQVTQRATRNVSFDSAFWLERLLAMETTGASADEISLMIETDVLSRTTSPLMDSAHMARTLTSYCGVVRRVTKDKAEAVDTAIQVCKRFLATAFAHDQTPIVALLTFQAQWYAFQIRMHNDSMQTDKWLTIWDEILRIRGGEAEAWLSFYDEYRFAHALSATLAQELREKVFTPAADRVHDYPQLIFERWLAFELAVGNHDEYMHVHAKYQSLVQQLQYQTPVVSAPAETPVPPVTEKPAPKKRKAESSPAEPPKRQKGNTSAVADTQKIEKFTNDNTLFVCNVAKDVTQDELHTLFAHISSLKDVRLVVKERGNHVKSRGMAYVQFNDDAGVIAGLELHGTVVHGQPIKVELSIPPSTGDKAKVNVKSSDTKGTKATTTVYVGGLLPPEREPITEDELNVALTSVLGEGMVKQVLILTDRRGRPKDYGLVEVASPSLVKVAVQKHNELQQALGDQLTVQTSRLTIEQVVRNRDEQKQATQKAKEERQMTKTPKNDRGPKTNHGGFQAKTAPHAKPHARLAPPTRKPVASAASLMPRALRKKTVLEQTTDSKPTNSTGSTSDSAPKTNADFRKLFMS